MSGDRVTITVDVHQALTLAHTVHVRLQVMIRDLKVMRSDDPDRAIFQDVARDMKAVLLATRDALDGPARAAASRFWVGLE